MKRKAVTAAVIAATAIAGIVVGFVWASEAFATPTVTFTTTSLGDQTFAFDASSTVCRYGPCSYNWRYYGQTTNRLGATLGYGVKVAFRFPAIGIYSVVLQVGERCSPGSARWCAGTGSTTLSAGPA